MGETESGIERFKAMSGDEVAAHFYAQMLGGVIMEGPPPPDSALGKILALENPTREQIRKLMRGEDLD